MCACVVATACLIAAPCLSDPPPLPPVPPAPRPPQAYSTCPGGDAAGDAAAVLGAIVRSRGLGAAVPQKVLEGSDARQAVKVRARKRRRAAPRCPV